MLFNRTSIAVTKTAAKALLLVGMAVGVSACGQRGALVPPTSNTSIQTEVRDPLPEGTIIKDTEGQTTQTKPQHNSFPLDPLL